MSHPIRLFFEILGSLTALLLVAMGLLLWRLSAGPILVPFVTPLLETALGEARAGLRIDVGETWIDWSDRSRSLELRVTDTRVYAPDGTEVARIPRAWMSLAKLSSRSATNFTGRFSRQLSATVATSTG